MINNYHPYLLHSVQQAILRDGSRDAVIGWLAWNDKNGIWWDEDCDREEIPRLTLTTAKKLMEDILNDA